MKKISSIITIIFIILIVSCKNTKEEGIAKTNLRKVSEIFKKEKAPENQMKNQEPKESLGEKILWTITSGALGAIVLFKLKKNKFI
jgi:hypothetical protein